MTDKPNAAELLELFNYLSETHVTFPDNRAGMVLNACIKHAPELAAEVVRLQKRVAELEEALAAKDGV